MRHLMLGLALISALFAAAQKTEQNFDYYFKPTENDMARYRVITEKQGALWYRQAFYVPEQKLAMEGLFKDAACTTSDGPVKWYHPKGGLMSAGAYLNDQKLGAWAEYDEKGQIKDSAVYANGKIRGVHLKWYDSGVLADSSYFDEAGNGVQVSWNWEGRISVTGTWEKDTVATGQWKTYYLGGQLKSVEDYAGGKLVTKSCYDTTGKALQNCEEKEATFAGGEIAWRRYLERSLNASIPIKNGAPAGHYTVVVQFIVNTDGSIQDVKALTQNGYGTEEEVVRLIQQGPMWIPGMQFGNPIRAYRKQPVTFVVWEEVREKRRKRGR